MVQGFRLSVYTFKLGLDSQVIIVGAGPAGSSAAYYLAKAGYSVTLLDRQSFPRDKVCGDFVGPAAIQELQALGVTERPKFRNANVIKAATVYLDGKPVISNPMPYVTGLEKDGRVVPRKVLDSLILNAARNAGANVVENVLVKGFNVEREGIAVTAQDGKEERVFKGSLLIGADGTNSIIARLLRGYQVPTANRIIGIRGYFEGVEGPSDQADMHFETSSFPGYCWLFPTGNGEANVGVGVLLDTLPKGNKPKDLLDQLMKQDEGLKSRLKNAALKGTLDAWPLSTYDPHLPIVGNRVMLIGEAAGLVNPLNGEGIQYALLSGRWAAETAQTCTSKGDFSEAALSPYAKRVHSELGQGFKISAFIIQLIRYRHLNPLWLKTFETMVGRAKSDPEYARTAGGILAGLLPTTDGLNPAFLVETVQEAAVSNGLRIVGDAVKDPVSLPVNAVKASQTALDVAVGTAQNPFGFVQWGMETFAKMAELAAAVPFESLGQTRRSEAKSVVNRIVI